MGHSEISQKGKDKYINACIWDLEIWYWWTYLQGSKREQACGHCGGRRGWDDLWEQHRNIYTTVFKIDRNLLCDSGSPSHCSASTSVAGMGWEGVLTGGDVCTPVAGSCWRVADTDTALQSNNRPGEKETGSGSERALQTVWTPQARRHLSGPSLSDPASPSTCVSEHAASIMKSRYTLLLLCSVRLSQSHRLGVLSPQTGAPSQHVCEFLK